MGCGCKSTKNIDNLILRKPKEGEKVTFFNMLSNISLNIINKVIISILMIILTPVVILMILWSFLFKDMLVFDTPKFISKYMKKHQDER